MTKNTVISVLAFLLLFVGAFAIKGCMDGKKEIKAVSYVSAHQSDTSTHWMDAYKSEHAKNVSLEETIDQLSQINQQQITDDAKRLKVDKDQIESMTRVIANLKLQIHAPVNNTPRGDTSASFTYHDPYSNIAGQTVGDQEWLQVDMRVPVKWDAYWQRPHKFLGIEYGKIQHFIDAHSENESVHLDSLSNVRIKVKEPGRFGIGVFGGVGIPSLKPAIGIGVIYSLIRF